MNAAGVNDRFLGHLSEPLRRSVGELRQQFLTRDPEFAAGFLARATLTQLKSTRRRMCSVRLCGRTV
jgi:hypothetical protein